MLVDYAAKFTSDENRVSGPWDRALVDVGVFSAAEGQKTVNRFFRFFCSHELCSQVAVFASVRVCASGGFGAVVGREKKAL